MLPYSILLLILSTMLIIPFILTSIPPTMLLAIPSILVTIPSLVLGIPLILLCSGCSVTLPFIPLRHLSTLILLVILLHISLSPLRGAILQGSHGLPELD